MREAMRIRRLAISNFRCFKHQVVDLSADLVMIYGRNGVGKTTLFDALEFALFGRVFRLRSFTDSPTPLRYAYAEGDETHARVELQDGTWVEASLDADGTARVAGSDGWGSHLDALYGLLVDPAYFARRRKSESVEEMFRATLLLSQDSIRRFVEGSTHDRAFVLATLAGSAHFHRCADKARSVAEEATKRLRKLESECAPLREQEEQVRMALADGAARLAQIENECPEADVISLADLLHQPASVGISQPVPSSDQADIREIVVQLRAACQERLDQMQQASALLSRLNSRWDAHLERSTRLERIDADLVEARRAASDIASRTERTAADIRVVSSDLGATTREIQRLTDVAQAFGAQSDLERRRLHTIQSIAEQDENLSSQEADLERIAQALESQQHAVDGVRHELDVLDQSALHRAAFRDRLQELRTPVTNLLSSRDRIQELDRELEAAREAERECMLRRESAKEGRAVELARVGQLEATLSEIGDAIEERTRLVARLRGYISNPICPVCGTEHDSIESLLEATDESLRSAPSNVQSLAGELESSRRTLDQATDRVRMASDATAAATAAIERLSEERAYLVESALRAEEQARHLNVEADPTAVQEALDATSDSLAELQRNREVLDARKQELEHEGQNLQARYGQLLQDRTRGRELRAKLADELGSILQALGDIERKISGIAEGSEDADAAQKLLEAAEDRARELQARLSQLERSQASNRMRLVEITARESSLEEEQSAVAGRVAEHRDLCTAAELPAGASRELLAERMAELEARRESLSRLGVAVLRLEVEARAQALRREQREREGTRESITSRLRGLDQQRIRLEQARSTASSWATVLGEHVNARIRETTGRHKLSIERHFKSLIPSPHVFEGVSLDCVGDDARLSIRYRNLDADAGEPRLYLSNAQANVLAIAIFLSLAATERWSRLETLLMDDPVQHLDDLDAVAFLDTLRATALGRFGRKKQIVVSTCDRNLYLMTIRKCRLLEKEGLTFRAISLVGHGVSGPEVIYDVGAPKDGLVDSA